MSPNIPLLLLQILFGLITTPVIFVGAGYFLFWHQCISPFILLFLSGLISASGLHLNILLFRQKLDEWYDPRSLQHMKVFALLSSGWGLVTFGYYVTKGCRLGDHFNKVTSNYIFAATSLLTMFLGAWFFYLCRWNKRFVELCDPLLSSPPRRPWRPF